MNAHDGKGQRHARLFRNGRSQAVRIPRDWEIEGDEVMIDRAEDGSLTLKPIRKKRNLLEVLATLEPLGEDEAMPEITDDDLLPLDDIKL